MRDWTPLPAMLLLSSVAAGLMPCFFFLGRSSLLIAGVLAFGVAALVTVRRKEQVMSEHQAIADRTDRLRCLGEMAGGLAHELNQPLSGLRGYAENLLISKKRGWPVSEKELVDKLTEIVVLTERMAALIDHVRCFVYAQEARGLEDVDTRGIIESALTMISAQFRGRGIDLDFRNEAENTVIKADPFSLEEVLLTVLASARDRSDVKEEEAGCARRAVSIRLLNDGPGTARFGESVTVEIADTGGRVVKDTPKRVRSPIWSIDGVRRTVEKFRGDLAVHSDAGRGTVVRLTFPVSDNARRERA